MKSICPALLLFALPATLLWLAPATHAPFLYDRVAISHGEWWRLWTGHWVHFSASHLLWNLVVMLVAGAWLERLQPGWLLRLALIVSPLLSLVLLFGEPAMQTYGGLSGLATSVVVLLALAQLRRRSPDRAWWWTILLLVAAKTGADAVRADSLFVAFGAQTVHPSVLVHAAGAVAALALFFARPIRPHTNPDQPQPEYPVPSTQPIP
jgi:rhomboid family GlyGly-CTERM serine protease